MLTHKQFKEAEKFAVEVSRSQGNAPMAIIRGGKRGWWDFDPKPWQVVLDTESLDPTSIYVGNIRFKPVEGEI